MPQEYINICIFTVGEKNFSVGEMHQQRWCQRPKGDVIAYDPKYTTPYQTLSWENTSLLGMFWYEWGRGGV